MADRLQVEAFFDPATSTLSYLVLDAPSGDCAVIDSVLDFEPKAARTSTASADRLIARVRELGATVRWVLDTHVHADHLSAALYVKAQLGGQVGIGQGVCRVQQVFARWFDLARYPVGSGAPFDLLLDDGATLALGGLVIRVLHTPGHTPACVTYVLEEAGTLRAAFVGDTLFSPDYGTARCDFPGGDARQLFQSIQRILALPPATALYLCHDYCPGGRALSCMQTVAEQRAENVHVRHGIEEQAFVTLRQARDAQLELPALMLPAVQLNLHAGQLPEPDADGVRYLKIPLNLF
ncbi:MBL fold metallo-hydrolase [Pseudomonas typographi]|uniref:MBL fold metallo-hydrolase n=1 Tax=Pseudomonas typographi TaxID=2715964 RepID=UPI001688DDD2|nr:MBL fold metallo-hydrolase [Pseudomonas typographi]MBD1553890.1 MBL fold metallo-hydrolase [Pseudomonas typographi]